MADVARLAVDGRFDVVERTDPLQRLAGDGAAGRLPDIVEVAPQMRPARRLAHARHAVGAGLVELLKARVCVGLQDAVEVGEVLAGVLALAVGGEPVGGCGRIAARPGAVVPDVDPDAALLHAALEPLDPLLPGIEHTDRGVIGVDAV